MTVAHPTSESPPPQAQEGESRRRLRWLTANPGRIVDVIVLVLIVGYTIGLMPGLTRWPPLINDEGREANLFWVASGADPAAERMNAFRGFATWGNGGLQGATAAVIFRLGGVGVFQARLTSLLWGGLLLVLVYWLGRRYWNRAVGLAAATLLAISNPFLVATHTLRPDVQVVVMIVGALLLVELALDAGTRRPLLLLFLSGLLLGLVVDTHPNGLAFFPLVGLVFPLRQGWLVFPRRREVWIFGLGIVGAALYYLAVRFVPDPAGFTAALGYWVGVDKALPVAKSSGGIVGRLGVMLTNEYLRYEDYFGEEPLELALVMLGLLGGLWMAIRGSYPCRLILLGLAFAALFFVVAVSTKSKYYMLLTYPLYVLLVARVLERIADWAGSALATRFSSLATRPSLLDPRYLLLAVLVVAAMVWPLKVQDRAWDNYIQARRYRAGQEYFQLTDRLNELAGPGAKILAPPVYWIGLRDHPYVDIYVYERLQRQYGMTPAQFLDETRPDFVITDAKIATDRRVERQLYDELDSRSKYELVVRHKSYGDVAIYRLRK
jgi:4-amino-4-deoxy-L-arabinose transferase-like glycosyltransferase